MGGSLTDDEISTFLSCYNKITGNQDIKAAVETGTYKGESSKVLSKFFSEVHTIEIQKKLFIEAQINNQDSRNIHYYLGDSVSKLPEIISKLKGPALFFIDAHISGSDSSWNQKNLVPLFQELDVVLSTSKYNNIFIFDDVRLFNKFDDWKGITTETIKQKFKTYNKKIVNDFVKDDRYYVIT